MKIKFLKNKMGTALLEVLIVLNIVSIAGISSSSMGILTMQNMALAEDFVVVQNIAVEAVEIIKNIRDTNWMRYPDNKKECWLNPDPTEVNCITEATVPRGSFILKSENGMWKLENKNQSEQAEKILNKSDYKYIFENNNTTTKEFYREIFISKLDEGDDDQTAKITINIVWKTGAKVNKFTTVTALTNMRK